MEPRLGTSMYFSVQPTICTLTSAAIGRSSKATESWCGDVSRSNYPLNSTLLTAPPPRSLADPLLTAKGIAQAQHTREVWEQELQHGLVPPGKIFCSPHSRALKTCEIVFDGYFADGRVTVVEVRGLLFCTLIHEAYAQIELPGGERGSYL